MTVPWMLKKGKATEVCHDCGDLRARRRARVSSEGARAAAGGGELGDQIVERVAAA